MHQCSEPTERQTASEKLKRSFILRENLDVIDHFLFVHTFTECKQSTATGNTLSSKNFRCAFLSDHITFSLVYCAHAHTSLVQGNLFSLELLWILCQNPGFFGMTKQLALRLVTPHVVFSSRVTSSSSGNASLSLCLPPQAQAGTAALPVVLVYIPLVLQSPSLSQLFSFIFFYFFIEQTPASTRVLSSSGEGNHSPLQIYILRNQISLNFYARICRKFEHGSPLRSESTRV